MKTQRLILFSLFSVVSLIAFSQSPAIRWEKSYGGSGDDEALTVLQTTDGGYIIGGHALSKDGDVTSTHDSADCWVVKTDSAGNIQWEKTYGGSRNEGINAIIQTPDGGYVFAAETTSDNGDVTGNHGGYDYWIVKLNASGNIVWQKCYGGSSDDLPDAIQQTADGGYIIAGSSASNDGDVTGQHSTFDPFSPAYDCWIVKIDSVGKLQWEDCYGGSNGEDMAYSVIQTSDKDYIFAGEENSTDGDVTGNHGASDYWVVKLDTVGKIIWEKSYGGSNFDGAFSIIQTMDKGCIVAGYSYSTDGDVTDNHGGADYWLVKLDTNGAIQWKKSLGGTSNDIAMAIIQTKDNGYAISGYSSSTDGDVTGNHGHDDYWVVKLDSSGALQWQKSLGGSLEDAAGAIQQTTDGGYIIGGYSESKDGNVTGNHGSADYWVVKLGDTLVGVKNIYTNLSVSLLPNPSNGIINLSYSMPAAKGTLTITNMLGEVVDSKTINNRRGKITLDESGLNDGIYFYTLTNKNMPASTGKFIIVR